METQAEIRRLRRAVAGTILVGALFGLGAIVALLFGRQTWGLILTLLGIFAFSIAGYLRVEGEGREGRGCLLALTGILSLAAAVVVFIWAAWFHLLG